MKNLSPRNFLGLIATERTPPAESAGKGRAVAVCRYECSACGTEYDDEDEAEECCDSQDVEDYHGCPVCAGRSESTRDASDCCLWKDIDAATRWRMADAVDAGSTWVEQLQALREAAHG